MLHGDDWIIDKGSDQENMAETWPFHCEISGGPRTTVPRLWEVHLKLPRIFDSHRCCRTHTVGHDNCGACWKAKATLRLVGKDEMKSLFDHVGSVKGNNTFDGAIKKIADGIKLQTNQTTARFKLFQQMPQGEQHFEEWYVKVKEQADRCVWTDYAGLDELGTR